MEQQRRLALAALTHDLKTPLSIISGNAELLGEEDTLTPDQLSRTDAILRSALRVEAYVAQLRAMTMGEAGADQKREAVSLLSLVSGWRETGRCLCESKGIFFLCPEAEAQDLAVYRNDLDRAVLNLLDNAVRYTPPGGTVTLTVTIENDLAHIAVTDTGPGFSPESLARGGEAFYTSDGSRPQEGHMGLGLFFASETARRHSGSLSLSNTETGAKAELVLPA